MERYLPLLVIWLHLAEKAVHPIEDLSPITEVIARREFHKLSRDCFFPTNNNEDDISKKRIIFKPWANRRKSFIFLKFFREFLLDVAVDEMKYQTFFRSTLAWHHMWTRNLFFIY